MEEGFVNDEMIGASNLVVVQKIAVGSLREHLVTFEFQSVMDPQIHSIVESPAQSLPSPSDP